MTRIAITGALGRMGTLVIQEAARSPDMQIVAGLDAVGAGRMLSSGIAVRDASELRAALQESRPDVLIDFTVADAAVENVCTAAEMGVDLVVGTTGFSADQHSRMREAIEGRVAAVITPNFSVGVNVFWKLVGQAAAALQDFDIEIIEAHHNKKKDAPSGTAMKAADVISAVLGGKEYVFGRQGIAPRKKEIGIHAVRGGDIVGDHTVLFAGDGERIEVKHQAHSRQAFASGAVKAAAWICNAGPGMYTMEDILGL